MTLLVLDTAGRAGGVALAREGQAVASRVWTEEQRHSEVLWPSIQALLEENGLTLGELGGVVACVGPGRLTGVRVGLTVARTICSVTGVPLVTVSRLDMESHTGSARESDFTPPTSLETMAALGHAKLTRDETTPIEEAVPLYL